MSKNFKGYMGDQIGKLGPAVGRRWKGMMIYASYQGNVSNPKTDAQQLIRERFATLSRLSTPFMPAIGISMKPAANRAKSTVIGEFIKLNQGAVTGSLGSVNVIPTAIKLSEGSLASVSFGAPDFSTPLQISVPITSNNANAYGASSDDKIFIVAYCTDAGSVVVSEGMARGTEESPATGVSIAVPTTFQGMNAHIFAFVANANNTKVSTSEYLGNGEIA